MFHLAYFHFDFVSVVQAVHHFMHAMITGGAISG